MALALSHISVVNAPNTRYLNLSETDRLAPSTHRSNHAIHPVQSTSHNDEYSLSLSTYPSHITIAQSLYPRCGRWQF